MRVTMRLQALKISASVMQVRTAGFSGQLHSTFRRVVNVLSEGQLVTIVDAELGELPNGVHVRMEPGRWFSDLGLQPGMDVRGDGSRLVVADGLMVLELLGADVLPGTKAITGVVPSDEVRLAGLRFAQAWGAALAPNSGLGPFWNVFDAIMAADTQTALRGLTSRLCCFAIGPLCELVAGLKLGDTSLVSEAVQNLAGLGCGLTPSCDDLLSGVVAALALQGEVFQLTDRLTPLLDAIVSAAEGQTNVIAWTYLRAASRREVTDVLCDYISALAEGSERRIETTTQKLFAVGETSGTEMALGALIGALLLSADGCCSNS